MTADLRELVGRVVARASGDEHVEAFAVRTVETDIEVLDGEVDALSRADTRGVGVRVITDGRQGYASTSIVTDEGLARALDQARTNASVATPDEANVLPDPGEPPDIGQLERPGFRDVPVEDKIVLATELEREALAVDAVRGVDVAKYGDAYSEAALASTRGLDLATARTDAWSYVVAMASADGETQTGLGVTLGRGPDELDVAAAGREGADRAVRLLGAGKPESARLPVVLDPYAAAMLLGVIAQALSAEAVVKGRSLFAGRLGEEVASPEVTLVDDGLRPDGPATSPWDAEGVPQQTTALIDSGVLASFLHNTWTSIRFGRDATSTGNASRGSFRSSPGVSPTNLFLRPGRQDQTAILDLAGDALYVQDVIGLHSGANPISGDLSVGITGLRVRGGELAEPVREATVASTIVDVLGAISAVGSDLRFLPFGGALGGSTVLVSEMAVSGH